MGIQKLHFESISDLSHLLKLEETTLSYLQVLRLNTSQIHSFFTQHTCTFSFHAFCLVDLPTSYAPLTRNAALTTNKPAILATLPGQQVKFAHLKQLPISTCTLLLVDIDSIPDSKRSLTALANSLLQCGTHQQFALSNEDHRFLENIFKSATNQFDQSTQKLSNQIIVLSLELLFNYILRLHKNFHLSRSPFSNNLISELENNLIQYYTTNKHKREGLPSVNFVASNLDIPARKLSKYIKRELGLSAQNYIHNFIIERAKTLLLTTDMTSSQIAYDLGFEYPQYFSRLFHKYTATTPMVFRKTKRTTRRAMTA